MGIVIIIMWQDNTAMWTRESEIEIPERISSGIEVKMLQMDEREREGSEQMNSIRTRNLFIRRTCTELWCTQLEKVTGERTFNTLYI